MWPDVAKTKGLSIKATSSKRCCSYKESREEWQCVALRLLGGNDALCAENLVACGVLIPNSILLLQLFNKGKGLKGPRCKISNNITSWGMK